ncbi:NUDIX hydrolase [Rhizobium lusitanum]|uniref:8-oxo-dGTP pyrophosphatase MutT (NUDIX family) n=1 Tax=Rhizobium lusitanum TaxID=293958 RepID=A0A7X0ME03_9HYPH|nr:NUDIX hydrolase [Rhizobium lusitanum]MBB6486981.1 8-oxo-dGTP pyrophosphatase MutT (NUDIX family) [Rhizobium lusitanum]
MGVQQTHPRRLALHTSTTFESLSAPQFGALCFRTMENGRPEILLITTRETHRWTIPKGWPIKGLKPHEVVEREAWEEAGIKGKAKKKPYGFYTYLKRLADSRTVTASVEVHALEVKEICLNFPETGQRTLIWLPPIEAALQVPEPQLKELLAGFMANEIGKIGS